MMNERITDKTQEQWEAEMVIWREQVKEYEARRDANMLEVGVKPGDTVEWHNVGCWNTVEILVGVLYLTKSGKPMVKIAGRRPAAWHKGFLKVGK